MKILLLLLGLFLVKYGQAQDCYNCIGNLDYLRPVVPEWPIEYTKIEKVDYERNADASYCKRPMEMVDTVVLHHSETPNTDSPQRLNEYHLARGSKDDPWLMIAYSYVINAPYSGQTFPPLKLSEGRPIEIVGAHAGTGVFVPMDDVQKKLWAEGKITCGKTGETFKVDPRYESNGKISANVSTIGLVVSGNYAPFSKYNPRGYAKNKPRFPTKETQDLIARMSCQLQKKHPRIKYIKWHSYYKATSCPGTIKNYLSKIKAQARKYGCEFN